MGWQALLFVGLLVGMLAGALRGRFRLDVGILGVLLALLLTGILQPAEAFIGFASPTVVTVAFLYVIATGLHQTGAMSRVGRALLQPAKDAFGAQARIALPVAALSAFVNNTPVVAMFLPVLDSLGKRIRVPASRLFMPLSFASILGGTCTLIGTSTNVVVAGLFEASHQGRSLQMFEFAWLGIPVAVCGILYLLVFGRTLLPDGSQPPEPEEQREYMAAIRVAATGPLVGKTIEAAGLRHLPKLFLARIERGGEVLVAVGPQERLQPEDILRFVGALDAIVDLQKTEGLEPITDAEAPQVTRSKRSLIQAVVASGSPLIGRSIRSAEVRTRYGAVIIAVHRRGSKIEGKLGDVVLQNGDSLLLDAEKTFIGRYRNAADFHLVSALDGIAAPRHDRAWVAVALFALLIVLLVGAWLPTVVSVMLVAALMGVSRCCTAPEARAGIDWTVLVVIGGAFGLGAAMVKTGLAAGIGQVVGDSAGALGPVALLVAIYALTTLLTAVVTNTAAAILMFPIAETITSTANLRLLPFALCIAVAASCEFSTPIGYQTNLMVMGPGGYRFRDYVRFGGPLTLLCGVVSVTAALFFLGPLTN